MTIPSSNTATGSVVDDASRKPFRHRPLLASIGTVLIDSFESARKTSVDISRPPSSLQGPSSLVLQALSLAQTDSTATQSRGSVLGSPLQSPSSRPSTASSTNSVLLKRGPISSGPSTPQREFDSPISSPIDNVREVLGGGGMYALIGARMWLGSSDLRCIVDRASEEQGRDFPRMLEEQLNAFGDEIWCWNESPGTRATKSRLKYVDGVRYFEYISPPPQRTIQSLVDTPVYGSEYLHISPPYTPKDTVTILEDLQKVRNVNGELWRPKILYEPHPRSCEPSQREWLEKAAPSIDILSPNHEELLAIYGQVVSGPSLLQLQEDITPLVNHLINDIGIGEGSKGAIVVRCGRHGSCVATKQNGIKWLPAYFGEEDTHRVVDVSGAGNSYLGGYAAGLHLSGGDPYEAALYATVSSSFMVEQVGLPHLTTNELGEEWNSDSPQARLELLKERVSTLDRR